MAAARVHPEQLSMSEGPSQLAAAIKRGDAARALALLEGMGAPALLQAVECPWGGPFSRCPKGCSGNLRDDAREFDLNTRIDAWDCNNHRACSVGAPGCQRSQARRAALTALSLPLWPLYPVTCGCIPGVCYEACCGDLPKFRHCSSCGWQACPNCNVEHATGTVLHIAAHCNMGADVICRLLNLGGRELLDRPDSTGKTARQLASDQSHTAVVSEIDRWSSQQTAWEQASNRNSSFIQAAQANDHDTLKRLMTQHLDIFAQDDDGCTVLHRTAEAGLADAVSLLVQEGGLRLAAMTDKRGKTARDLAVLQQRNPAVLQQWNLFVQSTGSKTNGTIAILDTVMHKLDTATVKKKTDLAPADDFERNYLLKYNKEQAQLREGASALLEQAEPLRRQHTSLVEDHNSALRQLNDQHDSALRQLHDQHATAIGQLETQLHRRNQELSEVMSKMYALQEENEDQLKALRSRVESLSQSYTSSYNASQHPLNPAQYKEMIRTILFSSSNTNASEDVGTKFSSDPDDLIVGLFEDATAGHAALLCVDEDELNARMGDGLEAMRAEVEALRDHELSFWFEYIVNQESSEQEYPQGTRDKGRAGRRLDDFLKTLQAKEADLKRAEVAALRLYTSPAFSRINGPLRNLARFREKRAHPLAVTVSFIVRGIKKLRRVDASAAAAIQSLVLWRGVKNVRITKQFIEKGGTELGALSTTTALGVAIDFSRSKRSLIFKIVTQNKLQRGADLHWLSIFPTEEEVLWPPLTYLQPTGKPTQEVEIDEWHFTILEVHTTQA